MDFPLDLKTRKFVTGLNEFKQTFTLIFKNYVGSFYQSRSVGSRIPEHGPDDILDYGIQETLKQMPGTELVEYEKELIGSEAYLSLKVRYNDNIETFKFSIDED